MARRPASDPIRALRAAQGKPISGRISRRERQRQAAMTPPEEPVRGITRMPETLQINLSDIEERAAKASAETSSSLQAAVVALRVKGWTVAEIAGGFGISTDWVRKALFDARQKADIKDVDILLDQRAAPLAVDNLMNLLERGDKDATFELLKGRGHLRTHQAVKSEGTSGNLTLNIAFAAPVGTPREPIDVAGQVFGQPRLGPGDGAK